MNLPSKLVEQAVEAFASLPGIGKKTALRLVLHMLQQDKDYTQEFTSALTNLRNHIKFCTDCHNLSDEDLCRICSSDRRNRETICVVEGVRDLMAIENTNQFNGLYHILGGVISPIEGIGPADLNIDTLVKRVADGEVRELIMALNPTIEGDTTIYYLHKQLADYEVKISTIARGVSFGGELEYADELTLGRSILSRTTYGGTTS